MQRPSFFLTGLYFNHAAYYGRRTTYNKGENMTTLPQEFTERRKDAVERAKRRQSRKLAIIYGALFAAYCIVVCWAAYVVADTAGRFDRPAIAQGK